ncbi:hypothetical protein HpBGD107_05630 [Helicobacter pylori]|uniref:hypothetical protein n=1 Tax=Helicobacter pylori TaxID=210 RepID=UPI0036F2ADFE
MGIDNKIELTQASGNFKKRCQRIRGNMVSKPPYPFKSLPSDFLKQSFKNNIKAQQECFI